MSDLLPLKEAIYEVGLLFNQAPSDDKITAYARALQRYTPQQVTYAFNQVILSGSAFFPSLAEILKHLRPVEERKEDLAPVIAAEMIKLVRAYGKHDEARMIMAASPYAKLAFRALGNTSDLRNSENIETAKAQLERLIKGIIANKEATTRVEQLERIGISTQKNEPQRLNYNDFSPEPA